MKSVFEIYESILDDDFVDDVEKNSYDEILGPEFAWVVCKDKKHLRFSKSCNTSLPKVIGERCRGGISRYNDLVIKNVDDIVAAKMEFLPMCYFDVNIPESQDLFYKIPCPWTANAYLTWDPKAPLNFNKAEIECKSVYILIPYRCQADEKSKLIAPKYHVDYCCVSAFGPVETISPSVIKDWDCDLLVVKCANKWHKSVGQWVHGDPMQQFHCEMVQELIDNNPKAKDIYIGGPYGDGFLYKCVGKKEKGKRVVTKMTPYKIETIEKKMDNYTSWCSKALEIHHEYEIKDRK